MFVYEPKASSAVALLYAMGLSRKGISRCTGISVRTISRWLTHGPPGAGPRTQTGTLRRRNAEMTRNELIRQMSLPAYAYLLGLYLGDGHIARATKGVFRLRIFLDSCYPVIVGEAVTAIAAVLPRNKPSAAKHPRDNLVIVSCYSKGVAKTLAPARSRAQTRQTNQAEAMAASNHRRAPKAPNPGADPLRRLSLCRQPTRPRARLHLPRDIASRIDRQTSCASSASTSISSAFAGR
jgi:hypothetical protein